MSKREDDYVVGQHNIQVLGLDIHNPVFILSAILVASFSLFALSVPGVAYTAMEGARKFAVNQFDWFFFLSTNLLLIFCIAIAFSPLGSIRLGGSSAKPEFGWMAWVAMLFSAGMGIGLMFFSAYEPATFYTSESGTPLGVTPETPEAARLAMSATLFHWGLTPWAIYAVVGLALAFFTFNRGLPLSIRSAFYPLLGQRVWGWPGHLIDLLAVFATLFGLATSLGLGAKQVAGGLEFLGITESTVFVQVVLIAFITVLAVGSVILGLHGGVRRLSYANMVLFVLLWAFVSIALIWAIGFGAFAFAIGDNTANYFRDFASLTHPYGRDDADWYHGWTIFYWAWWISWSPFVGTFIARISEGRTVREFLLTVLVLPLVVTVLWFTTFGEAAIWQVDQGVETVAASISDGEVELVLYRVLGELPLATITSAIAVLLVIVFFVTSSDSGSLVIDSITAGGKLDAPVPQRIFWAVMEGLVAAILLLGGGTQALDALKSGTIATGLPFALILLLVCISLTLGLMDEKKRRHR